MTGPGHDEEEDEYGTRCPDCGCLSGVRHIHVLWRKPLWDLSDVNGHDLCNECARKRLGIAE